MNNRERTIDLNGCARCFGESHPRLTFKPLLHPVVIEIDEWTKREFTHWAPCPTNGEPILMEIRENVS